MDIEDIVIAKISARRDKGLQKYGISMERTDLTTLAWLQHAQDEAMDLAIYLERLMKAVALPEQEARGILGIPDNVYRPRIY